MQFNSFEFLIFFAIVFPLYCALNRRWQNHMLLVASYVFYGWVEPWFLIPMAATTAADFFIGMRIEDAFGDMRRKRWLIASLVMNLGLLAAFKYLGFAQENLQVVLRTLGLKA